MNPYEATRDARVAHNKSILAQLVTTKLPQEAPAPRAPRVPRMPVARAEREPPRRSVRSEGKQVDYTFDAEAGERKPRIPGPPRIGRHRLTAAELDAMTEEEREKARRRRGRPVGPPPFDKPHLTSSSARAEWTPASAAASWCVPQPASPGRAAHGAARGATAPPGRRSAHALAQFNRCDPPLAGRPRLRLSPGLHLPLVPPGACGRAPQAPLSGAIALVPPISRSPIWAALRAPHPLARPPAPRRRRWR